MKSLAPPLFYQYPAHLDLWTSDGVNRALKHLIHPSVQVNLTSTSILPLNQRKACFTPISPHDNCVGGAYT